jgi:hypothetical protein
MKPTPIAFAALFLSLGAPCFAGPAPATIRNGSVTAPKIATNAVTASKIAAGAVTGTKLAPTIGVWDKNGTEISYTAGQVFVNTTTATSDKPPMVIRAAATNHFIRLENSNGTPGWEILNDNFGFDITETDVTSGRLHIAVGGNVGIGTQNPTSKLQVAGEAKATVFTPTSDRNAKQDFTPVDSREVLAKVVALPITEWQYKTIQDARHMGPVAQDFRKAFGLGSDDKGISTVDADGVALAAIQGLNDLVEEKDAEISKLEERLAKLEERLNDLVK